MTQSLSISEQAMFFHAGPPVGHGPSDGNGNEAKTAESREHDRVAADGSALTVRIGRELHCPVLDIGRVGLSVITREHYAIGDVVDAAIECLGTTFTGQVCVQHMTVLDDGRVHCGLLCTEDPICVGGLTTALGLIAITAHHEL